MRLAIVLLCACLSACATSSKSQEDFDLAQAMRPYQAPPSTAVTGDLGTMGNPVRVLMPEGERAYLHRLRCGNGGPPTFERRGSGGIGPYGKILDIYSVVCPDQSATVYMDMYHCTEEALAIPGFEIVPEIGSPAKEECR